MQCLVGQLGGERALFSHVAHRRHEVQEIAVFVAGAGFGDLGDDDVAVRMDEALGVAATIDLAVEQPLV